MFNSPINGNSPNTLDTGFSFSNPTMIGNTGSGSSSGSSTVFSFGAPSFGSFPPSSPAPAHDEIMANSAQAETPKPLFGGYVNNTGWASNSASLSSFSTPRPSTTPTGSLPPTTSFFGSMATSGSGNFFDASSSSVSSGTPAVTSQPVYASPFLATGRPGTSHGYTATNQTTSPFGDPTTLSTPFTSIMFSAAAGAKNSAGTSSTGAQSPFPHVPPTKNQVSSIFTSAAAPVSVFDVASTTPKSVFVPTVSAIKSPFELIGPPPTPAPKAPSIFAPPLSAPPESPFANATPTAAAATLGPTAVSSVTPATSLFTSAMSLSSTTSPNVAKAALNFVSLSTGPTQKPLLPSVAPLSPPFLASAAPVKTSAPALAIPTQTAPSGPNATGTSTSLIPNTANSNAQAAPAPSLSQTNRRPEKSRLKDKSLEEIIEQWASNFEKYQKEFHKCGSNISKWDLIFVESSDKIVKLTTEVKEAERTQSIINNALEQLENEQEHLGKLFDYYENSLAEMEKESTGAQPTDSEREQIFDEIVTLSAKLTDMEIGAADLVSALNNASAKVENIGTNSHFSLIIKILNEHFQVMQWVDSQTVALSEKIQNVHVNSKAPYTAIEEDEIMRNFDKSHGVKF